MSARRPPESQGFPATRRLPHSDRPAARSPGDQRNHRSRACPSTPLPDRRSSRHWPPELVKAVNDDNHLATAILRFTAQDEPSPGIFGNGGLGALGDLADSVAGGTFFGSGSGGRGRFFNASSPSNCANGLNCKGAAGRETSTFWRGFLGTAHGAAHGSILKSGARRCKCQKPCDVRRFRPRSAFECGGG